MTTLEALETKVRATRRVSSIPLIVSGVGTIVAASASLLGDLDFALGFVIAPGTAFVLWAVMKATATRAGLGMGRERYGLIALIIAAASLLPVISWLLGPAFLIGILLLTVGWRAEDRRQWGSGLLVAAASPLLGYSFIQNQVYVLERAVTGWYWFTDMTVDHVVLAVIGLALAALGIREARRENALLRQRS
ncbi:hypothetical protein [Cryobacterium sp. CG_9.6]|uniref:hypothetical protein n=1 Tax=Cryobacterium sp. CG_9.6 TaxID=2760710 RepID=UPI0024750AE6|nr:hypothetical protein [Cryobacterium sp. CG_9.6]MDH6237143.1 hypothetical protein [Cryobacterium sp. CG_9.6]